MAQFINIAFNGLSLTSIILLTSIGLAITFGLMKVINMAHGEFVMIGAYMTFLTQQFFVSFFPESVFSLYYVAALFVAFGVTFLLGCVMEKLVISRLYGRVIDSLLATAGISLLMQQGARHIFGAQGVNVTTPEFLRGAITIGEFTFSRNRLWIIFLAIFVLVAVWFVLYKSKFSRQVRPVMQNRPMAQCLGINSKKIDNITFGIGSGLAGLAGCSVALLGSTDASVGQLYIVNAFMAVVLGGVGNLVGTILGASIIGYSSVSFETFTSAAIARAMVLLLIVIFLQRKPQGLFTIRTRTLDE
jgi:urea transport system permease protein